MSLIDWDGHLPVRRYAIFRDLTGDYIAVVKWKEMGKAEKMDGFVSWLGGIKPAETRAIKKSNAGG